MSEETMTTGEIVQGRLTEIAKVAMTYLDGMGFIVVALHGDGYVQYTSSIDPLQAGAIMLDLGKSITEPEARPDWYEFQNCLRVMQSTDRHDLIENGIIDADNVAEWNSFVVDPYRWLMKADDRKAEAIWLYIQKRSARK